MEMGYNTLDLAMLVIAMFVIYIASRVPEKKSEAPKSKFKLSSKQKGTTPHSSLV